MSTTNDEQAMYDAVIEKGVHIPELGTIANLADVQQPKEREPVLPILTTYDEHSSKYGVLGREIYFVDGWTKGAAVYHNAVESLITTGKLRVVEEVELVDGICPTCGYDAGMPMDVNGQDMTPPCCSGCGNKIKR